MSVMISWGEIAYVAICATIIEFGAHLDRHPKGYSCPSYCGVEHKHLPIDETFKEFIKRKHMKKNNEGIIHDPVDSNLEEIIDEYDYDREIFDTIDYYQKKIETYNNKINKKIHTLENLYFQKEFDKGYDVNNLTYYKDEKHFGYRINKKRKIGFQYQKKGKK